jgi:Tfp pilus assembly protein PilF
MQSAAALEIARVFHAGMSPSATNAVERPLTEDSAALRLYRLGRYLYNKGAPGDMQKSVQYFKEAIAHDSSFAHAYVSLADAIAFVGERELRPAVEWQPEAERYLRKALTLDESIPEAHSLLALYYSEYAYDLLSAEQEHRRAVELNPNSSDAHLWMGLHFFVSERTSDAVAEYQRAIQLEPLLPLARMHLARALIFAGQNEQAEPYLQKGIELYPDWPMIPHLIATSLIARGMEDSAVKVLNRAERTPWNGYLYAIAGRPDVTRKILDSLLTESRKRPLDPLAIAVLQMGLGDKEQAIAWLQKAYAERSDGLRYVLGPHPAFRPIRSDPRIQELRRRVGFRRL